jgi:hypothetical protein
MAFMQKQVEWMAAWQVETTLGTECVPCDVRNPADEPAGLGDYLAGEQIEGMRAMLVTGFFWRLSAPGYMDCTEWCGPFATEAEAKADCDEMYPDDEEDAA